MSQTALPVSPDIVAGNWTPTPIWSQIDQPYPPNDTSYVTSGSSPVNDTFVVSLAPLLVPKLSTSSGQYYLKVRFEQLSAGTSTVRVWLLQAGRPIAYQDFTPTPSFAYYTLTLTDAQVASITDFSKLQAAVTANPTSNCCPNLIPSTLYLTISGCSCITSSQTLTYSTGIAGPGWYSSAVPCGTGTLRFCFQCLGSTWQLTEFCTSGSGASGSGVGTTVSCTPGSFQVQSSTSAFGGQCCLITSTWAVTD